MAFVSRSTTEEEIDQLLLDSKSKNTNRFMQSAIKKLRAYLDLRNFGLLEDIANEDLPNILTTFYTDVRKQKDGEQFQASSFKMLRAPHHT